MLATRPRGELVDLGRRSIRTRFHVRVISMLKSILFACIAIAQHGSRQIVAWLQSNQFLFLFFLRHCCRGVLKPVRVFPDAARTNGALVMCEVMMPDGKTPRASNKRATI